MVRWSGNQNFHSGRTFSFLVIISIRSSLLAIFSSYFEMIKQASGHNYKHDISAATVSPQYRFIKYFVGVVKCQFYYLNRHSIATDSSPVVSQLKRETRGRGEPARRASLVPRLYSARVFRDLPRETTGDESGIAKQSSDRCLCNCGAISLSYRTLEFQELDVAKLRLTTSWPSSY